MFLRKIRFPKLIPETPFVSNGRIFLDVVVYFWRLLLVSLLSVVVPAYAFANQSPYGWLDAVSYDVNSHKILGNGWALDPDTTASIAVHFYMNGPAGSGTFAGAVVANFPRADVNAATGVAGDHGFSFEIPWNCYNIGQTIYVYMIDASGNGPNPLTSGSPRGFVCSSNPPVHN